MAQTPEERKAVKRESDRIYYIAHREQKLAQAREWHKNHPEQSRAHSRASAAAHRKERNAMTQTWKETHPEEVRAFNKKYNDTHKVQIGIACIRRTYKVSVEEAERLYTERQTGVCAICGGNRSNNRVLDIDHDHDTNIIRGLLCHSCNVALGHMAENPDWLRSLADYAQRAKDNKEKGQTNG